MVDRLFCCNFLSVLIDYPHLNVVLLRAFCGMACRQLQPSLRLHVSTHCFSNNIDAAFFMSESLFCICFDLLLLGFVVAWIHSFPRQHINQKK